MASNIATGALSRTRGSPGGAWCSGTCCTSARSTTLRNWRGGGRSRFWKTARRNPARCRCFRRTAVKGCWETPRSSASSCRNCGCAGRGSGARAGWRWCWWRELQLDQFWSKRLGVSRKGTRWDQVLFVLVAYRLLPPGSEWRLHREWVQRSALADLLGEDAGLAEIPKLYRCHDRLLVHKQAVFDHLGGRWRDLFNISYDVLLYDLTSTYFEADPPFPEGDKRRFGYSRDHRPDCVQIVIALVVTPEGLPLAYEVLPGNTADKTTLRGFLDRIERQYPGGICISR